MVFIATMEQDDDMVYLIANGADVGCNDFGFCKRDSGWIGDDCSTWSGVSWSLHQYEWLQRSKLTVEVEGDAAKGTPVLLV